MKKDFIGVFDSGVGGLTVLDKLVELMPNENYFYVGDQGHCPYGPKPQEYVGDRVEKICRYLEKKGAKAIVIACNTASLQIERGRKVCNIPIISVIQPTCAKAITLTKNKKVAVLATEATIKSGTYQKLLEKDYITPVPLACGEFVTFAESGDKDFSHKLELVKTKLEPIKNENFDTLIHGCTHFSLLEDAMKEVLGNINYVACGDPTSEELQKILKDANKLTTSTEKGWIKIFTTGKVKDSLKSMSFFEREHKKVKKISIEK